jgi:hypothetical protein
MKLDNKLYDILNKIQRWLPYIGIFYLALCKTWGLPLGNEVNQTIIALGAFLAATLEISTGIYHKDVSSELIGQFVSDSFDEDEPEQNDAE